MPHKSGGWEIVKTGSKEKLVFETKKEAEHEARKAAHSEIKAKLIIYKKDGTFQKELAYNSIRRH